MVNLVACKKEFVGIATRISLEMVTMQSIRPYRIGVLGFNRHQSRDTGITHYEMGIDSSRWYTCAEDWPSDGRDPGSSAQTCMHVNAVNFDVVLYELLWRARWLGSDWFSPVDSMQFFPELGGLSICPASLSCF